MTTRPETLSSILVNFVHSGEFADAGYLFFKFKELGLPLDICREYMDKVASLVGHGTQRVAFEHGGPLDTERILAGPHSEDFLKIEWLIPVKDLDLSPFLRQRVKGEQMQQENP